MTIFFNFERNIIFNIDYKVNQKQYNSYNIKCQKNQKILNNKNNKIINN